MRSPAGRGRPPIADAEDRILEATIDELAERGYDGLSMSAVARRAGLARATIYRRWAGRDALVLDAVDRMRRQIPEPCTGDARADLVEVLNSTMAVSTDRRLSSALASITAKALHDDGLRFATETRLKAPHTANLRTIVERGVATGHFDPNIDVEIVVAMLDALAPYYGLIAGPPPPGAVERAVDAILTSNVRTVATTRRDQ